MTIEICLDSFETALLAKKYAAKRIELCSALTVGGLTPGIGLATQCAQLNGIEVHTMIRHREGDFVYNENDIQIMLADIKALHKTGIKGIVFGCLTPDYQIDPDSCKRLIGLAKQLGLSATFHRAFDYVENPNLALEQLIEMGFNRLLTSGQKETAPEGIELIRELIQQAKGRIEIMAGCGINASNAIEMAKTGVDALHFTSHSTKAESYDLGMGSNSIPNEEIIAGITKLF